jgi:hypothetical protein
MTDTLALKIIIGTIGFVGSHLILIGFLFERI